MKAPGRRRRLSIWNRSRGGAGLQREDEELGATLFPVLIGRHIHRSLIWDTTIVYARDANLFRDDRRNRSGRHGVLLYELWPDGGAWTGWR